MQEAMCEGKQKYSRYEAEMQRYRQTKRHTLRTAAHSVLKAYKCSSCKQWHIGAGTKTNRQAEPYKRITPRYI